MKRVLVTGGSRGIGAAIVDKLKTLEYEVVCPSRQELNLSDAASVKSFIENDNSFDILINNAGINPINALENIPEYDWDETNVVNLKSPFLLAQGFAPHMKKNQWGRIINISSIFGIASRAERSVYTSTKAGVNGLTTSLAVELGEYNILVNSICPGYIMTDLTKQNNSEEQIAAISQTIPTRRLGKPEEIAEVVVFLISGNNTYITGQHIAVDGGFLCQ